MSSNKYYKNLVIGILMLFSLVSLVGGAVLFWGFWKFGEVISVVNVIRAMLVGFVSVIIAYLIFREYWLGLWLGFLTILLLILNKSFKLLSPYSDKFFIIVELGLLLIAGYSLFKLRDQFNSNISQ